MTKNIDPSNGQFIDPMFAVVIAAAVSETVVLWVKSSAAPSVFIAAVSAVGFINLLLSWFGYHKSILRKPILGSLRFITTVILLPLYLLTIIVVSKGFEYVSLVYTAIFFLWSLWEYFKYIEHQDPKGFLKLQCRGFNISVYLITLFLFISPHLPSQFQTTWIYESRDWIALATIFLSILYLRIVKSAGTGDTPTAKIIAELKNLLFGEQEKNSN